MDVLSHGLHENSGYEEWEGAMGTDSGHLTEMAYRKIAESITQMSRAGMQSSAAGSESWRRRRRGPPRSSWAGKPGSTDPLPVTEGAEEGAAWAEEESLAADVADLELACTPAATGLARLGVALAEAAATAATTATATSAATPPRKGKWEFFPISLSHFTNP